MGLYYSGGYDWTFVPGPIAVASDHQTVKPQSEAMENTPMHRCGN